MTYIYIYTYYSIVLCRVEYTLQGGLAEEGQEEGHQSEACCLLCAIVYYNMLHYTTLYSTLRCYDIIHISYYTIR